MDYQLAIIEIKSFRFLFILRSLMFAAFPIPFNGLERDGLTTLLLSLFFILKGFSSLMAQRPIKRIDYQLVNKKEKIYCFCD